MSIILKGNNISSSNNKGIGPGEVTNIKASQNASSIILSWTNPSNVVINGTTLSIFDHVIIVRNEDRYPMNIKDGTLLYNGNAETYTDSNVVKNKTYYYRFFTYDTNKKSNNSMDMIIESIFYGIDPILRNNTWEQINAASEAGIASSIWNIGDEIDITFTKSAKTHDGNVTYTFQIWDFNHFDKSDGSGKAGICFGMKNLSSNTLLYYTGINNDRHQWEDCGMRTYLNDDSSFSISDYSAFPDDCKNYIKSVDVYTAKSGSDYYVYSDVIKTSDKLFLPGSYELGLEYNDEANLNGENINLWKRYQTIFPIFTDDNSRIKKSDNGTGDPSVWITRTPDPYEAYAIVKAVNKDGSRGARESMDSTYGTARCVCYCFNI